DVWATFARRPCPTIAPPRVPRSRPRSADAACTTASSGRRSTRSYTANTRPGLGFVSSLAPDNSRQRRTASFTRHFRSAKPSVGARRGALACHGAREQAIPLAHIFGEGRGALELRARLLVSSQALQQVRSRAREQVIALERGLVRQRVEKRET